MPGRNPAFSASEVSRTSVYRIADSRHPIFDGTGAFLKGGRWNSRGLSVIDAAETYAGALLQILAHLTHGAIHRHYACIAISFPSTLGSEILEPAALPGWNAQDRVVSQAFGDLWPAQSRSCVLRVPSAVVQGRECNVLLNPAHPDFGQITATRPRPVDWDPRLFPR